MNNSVKVAYIVCSCIGQIFMLLFAALAPIYITPNLYWWTAAALICLVGDGWMLGKRMNLWTGEV